MQYRHYFRQSLPPRVRGNVVLGSVFLHVGVWREAQYFSAICSTLFHPRVGVGGCSLSLLPLGERRGAPWTGSSQGHTEENKTSNHAHSLNIVNIETSNDLTCMFLTVGGSRSTWGEFIQIYWIQVAIFPSFNKKDNAPFSFFLPCKGFHDLDHFFSQRLLTNQSSFWRLAAFKDTLCLLVIIQSRGCCVKWDVFCGSVEMSACDRVWFERASSCESVCVGMGQVMTWGRGLLSHVCHLKPFLCFY